MRAALCLLALSGVAAFHGMAPARVSSRVSSLSMLQAAPKLQVQASSSFALRTAEVSIQAAESKKSPLDLIWNESTKLWIYLGVWYLGNIYCEWKQQLIQLT